MQEKPMEVKGVAQADFQAWKHHPVTKVFHQYLIDYHGALKERAWDAVLGDPDIKMGELVGRAKTLAEIVDLPFESMLSFYQQEEQDAAEIN